MAAASEARISASTWLPPDARMTAPTRKTGTMNSTAAWMPYRSPRLRAKNWKTTPTMIAGRETDTPAERARGGVTSVITASVPGVRMAAKKLAAAKHRTAIQTVGARAAARNPDAANTPAAPP